MKSIYLNRILSLCLGLLVLLSSCSDDEMVDPEAQLEQDVAAIDQYLASNDIDAFEDPSGLRYVINDIGLGKPFEEADLLYISYEGSLISDGSVFDSPEGFVPIATDDIPLLGWQIGLPLISEGGSITLYIPSGLAFGGFSADGLPANSNVIYTLELYDSEESIAADGVIIDNYLRDNNIVAETDPETDLRYVINAEGEGVSPTVNSTIVITYEGRFLDGEVFDSAEAAVFELRSLIQGWQLGLPLIKEGGSISLYIPSYLAYGPNGRPPSIPGEAIMVFDITLEVVL